MGELKTKGDPMAMEANDNLAIIILAAGLGKRMQSDKAKVLHEILGKPMILHVVETASKLAGDRVVVVVGHQAGEVRRIVSERFRVRFAVQERQLGTAHAVQSALPFLHKDAGHVIVLCGDVPLIRPQTLKRFLEHHYAGGFDVSVLAVKIDRPKGYGRILRDAKGNLEAIVEEADATEDQKKIDVVNSGIYCVERGFLQNALRLIQPDNAQGEFYFTDIISIGRAGSRLVGAFLGDDFNEVLGVNTPEDLKRLETMMCKRIGKIS
jgi:bifunctional UDP-N-acetylglucosamine pyrophosphorylase/glucosamine-1-phosphate N-acetyltransferase/UDP-N-acetylglucosamine pyrophosphorylase